MFGLAGALTIPTVVFAPPEPPTIQLIAFLRQI